MIIDCHGHYTTAPKALEDWRNRQIAGIKNPSASPKVSELKISDDELRQMTAEELATERTRNGYKRQVWRKTRERNEALDCLVYAYAAGCQMGMNRFNEAAWDRFSVTLGDMPAPPAPKSASLKPAAAPPVAAAKPAGRPGILAPRPRAGNWLGRR